MTPEMVVQIFRETLMTAFWLCAPLLAVGFVVGIIISLIQIVTSIQDTGFSTIPRLAAFLVAVVFSMPWMLKRITVYTVAILGDLGRYAR
jgi:flagellar biosynthesis protein FliQ